MLLVLSLLLQWQLGGKTLPLCFLSSYSPVHVEGEVSGTEVIISSVSAASHSTVETHMQITDTSCKGACLWLLSSA